MSKSTCEPIRIKNPTFVCEICGMADGDDWEYHSLETQILPVQNNARDYVRTMHRFEDQERLIWILCIKCLEKILCHIQKIRHHEHYYEKRCKRLEKKLTESNQKLITDERTAIPKEQVFLELNDSIHYVLQGKINEQTR